MSSSKRPMEDESSDSSIDEDSSGDEEMGEEEELGENDREIQVDFAGQSPCAEDFHGIKGLLHQLFLKAHVNLSNLAELIIEQNYVGSILQVNSFYSTYFIFSYRFMFVFWGGSQQCVDDNQDSDEDESSADEVFGITSVINLTHHKVEASH